MILYKNHQNQFLVPVFIGMIMVLLNIVPVMSYFNAKATNTDSLPVASAGKKLEKIAALDKTETSEIEVPALGSSNTNAAGSSAYVAPIISASVCANTPTPGYNQISVCGRVISLDFNNFYAGVTPADGRAVKWTYRNFIFGHNSYDVFGGLHNILQAGDPIIVNLNGVENTYYFVTYWQNRSTTDVDAELKPYNNSDSLGIMTCAPWVGDGLADTSRYDFLFKK